jgi:chromosome segregation ATPase
MNVDLRGFRHAAEPLLLRRRWELEALQSAIAKLQRRTVEARAALDALAAERTDRLGMATPGPRALDPQLHAARLRWLLQQQQRIAQAEAGLAALQAERETMVAQSVLLQQRIRTLESDRDTALRAFAQVEAGRTAAQADRDWLARRPLTDSADEVIA